MLVGAVSNTVGRVDALSDAIGVLWECGAERLYHCGDVGGRHVLDVLADMDSAFVWGERDADRMGLLRQAQRVGVICHGVLGDFEIDGKRFALVHGDDPKLVKTLLGEQQYDYLLCGHQSEHEDRRVGKTRVVCPGSIYGASKRTVVLLDTETDQLTLLNV